MQMLPSASCRRVRYDHGEDKLPQNRSSMITQSIAAFGQPQVIVVDHPHSFAAIRHVLDLTISHVMSVSEIPDFTSLPAPPLSSSAPPAESIPAVTDSSTFRARKPTIGAPVTFLNNSTTPLPEPQEFIIPSTPVTVAGVVTDISTTSQRGELAITFNVSDVFTPDTIIVYVWVKFRSIPGGSQITLPSIMGVATGCVLLFENFSRRLSKSSSVYLQALPQSSIRILAVTKDLYLQSAGALGQREVPQRHLSDLSLDSNRKISTHVRLNLTVLEVVQAQLYWECISCKVQLGANPDASVQMCPNGCNFLTSSSDINEFASFVLDVTCTVTDSTATAILFTSNSNAWKMYQLSHPSRNRLASLAKKHGCIRVSHGKCTTVTADEQDGEFVVWCIGRAINMKCFACIARRWRKPMNTNGNQRNATDSATTAGQVRVGGVNFDTAFPPQIELKCVSVLEPTVQQRVRQLLEHWSAGG
jgi:hypothetical protein